MTDTLDKPAAPARELPRYNAQRIGFAAGVIAAVAMLIAVVVLRALSGVVSLPEVIADGVLTLLPGALFSTVLDALQRSAKPLFYVAVVVGMLIVGGFLGRYYATAPGWKQAARLVGGVWALFGVGVYTVLGAGIFGQHLIAGPIWHAV